MRAWATPGWPRAGSHPGGEYLRRRPDRLRAAQRARRFPAFERGHRSQAPMKVCVLRVTRACTRTRAVRQRLTRCDSNGPTEAPLLRHRRNTGDHASLSFDGLALHRRRILVSEKAVNNCLSSQTQSGKTLSPLRGRSREPRAATVSARAHSSVRPIPQIVVIRADRRRNITHLSSLSRNDAQICATLRAISGRRRRAGASPRRRCRTRPRRSLPNTRGR